MRETHAVGERVCSWMKGVLPVLPTPFLENEEIDYANLERLAGFCLRVQPSAITLPAYAGEFYKLGDDERLNVIKAVIDIAAGAIPVIAQCNHHSSKVAAELAKRAEAAGASAIAVALPRAFPIDQEQLLNFAQRVASSVSLPFLVQDWNPGGSSVSADFVARLSVACPNFSSIKLEEPGMGEKTRAIRAVTQDRISVVQGWGGLYMFEAYPQGIAGIMPGVAPSDVLIKIWRLLDDGKRSEAFELFAPIVPLLVFSLQDIEQFHHVEKRILVRRGVLPNANVRSPTKVLESGAREYLEFLIDRALEVISRAGLSQNPLN